MNEQANDESNHEAPVATHARACSGGAYDTIRLNFGMCSKRAQLEQTARVLRPLLERLAGVEMRSLSAARLEEPLQSGRPGSTTAELAKFYALQFDPRVSVRLWRALQHIDTRPESCEYELAWLVVYAWQKGWMPLDQDNLASLLDGRAEADPPHLN